MKKLLLYQATVFLAVVAHCTGTCMWYGQCGHQQNHEDKKLNCIYHGPPKPFKTKTALDAFARDCPSLYKGNETETCCSDPQMLTMDNQISFPRQALQRCPSCFHNFMNVWCYLTCAPNNMPSSNTPALSLLCGTDASQCTPQKWLDYMGTTDNGQAPFDIHFYISKKNMTFGNSTLKPLNTEAVPCSQAPSNDTEPCSCQDCKATCAPSPPPAPPSQPCEVAHLDCYYFGFGVLFAAFVLVFGCYIICYNIIVQDALRLERPDENGHMYHVSSAGPAANRNERKKNYLASVESDSLSFFERAGARMEERLENLFAGWGHFCASHPLIMSLVVLVIAGALCAGVSLFTVTTNPVKLWSAPDSRARTEKEYYDSHFVPFYRTEQLIISRPDNDTLIEYKKRNYSNLLDKEFLHEILDLQLAIEGLTAEHDNKTVGLEDICFAPLSPDNKNCTVQSILNYFQNSHAMLDKVAYDEFGWFVVANYLDHFDYCVDSPFSPNDTTRLHTPCLGTFGGPVFPWVALGGYREKVYRNTSALVITFVVNNYLDASKNGPALAWEAKFIDFMKNYTEDHPEVEIAFSSERSIEDEIERESNSDIMTILASYLIMFAYITLMLGQYRRLDRILITIFICLLTLDAKRQHSNRIDVFCCSKLPLKKRKPQHGLLYELVSEFYSHFLMMEWLRPIVMVVFVGWFCASAAMTSKVNIGLDQSLSMPKGHNYSSYEGQNAICGISGCPENSLVQQVDHAAENPLSTRIAESVSSWLDDYFSWLNSPSCCRIHDDTGDFCPST
ncbi:niemann-Pick C1 protein, partial [Elysia marginata]